MKGCYKKSVKIINCLAKAELAKEEEIFLLDEIIKGLEKIRCVLVGEKPSTFRRNKIVQLKIEGLSQAEIARRIKTSRQYVFQVLKDIEGLNLIQELPCARV